MSLDLLIARLPQTSQQERDRIRANAKRWLDKGSPAQKDQAARMIAALDDLALAERQRLYAAMVSALPAARVVEAFRKHPPTDVEARVIRALIDNPGSTSAGLSAACGWRGQIWHTHFGEMCKARETWLWPAPPSTERQGVYYTGSSPTSTQTATAGR